jgi:hypothetical protein
MAPSGKGKYYITYVTFTCKFKELEEIGPMNMFILIRKVQIFKCLAAPVFFWICSLFVC